jgi:hypothetical protein
MFDSINLPILFEHERSTNKEFCLDENGNAKVSHGSGVIISLRAA